MVLNTPTVLLDKDFDPFDHQIVPNCSTEWDSTSALADHLFVTAAPEDFDEEDDDDKDDDKRDDTVSLTRCWDVCMGRIIVVVVVGARFYTVRVRRCL